MREQSASEFHAAFRGRFENVLRWEQLDDLRDRLEADADAGWYIYAVGEAAARHTFQRRTGSAISV